ncbi:SH3 domain-containing protein [Streptomyces sp. NPDC127049]|uniref:SH3 domain-containing protein n=1 Tax=Streptomyces sp. NPDC127049 TaxID=3347118 RepID=UPI00364C43A2
MRTLKSTAAVAAVTGAMALAGVLGTAGTAGAAPAGSVASAEAAGAGQVQAAADYSRKVWKTVNHRTGPSGDYEAIGKLYANRYYTVRCWRVGESVTAEGTTNNVWILARNDSGRWGYSSAIYFSGNKYADLPASARC